MKNGAQYEHFPRTEVGLVIQCIWSHLVCNNYNINMYAILTYFKRYILHTTGRNWAILLNWNFFMQLQPFNHVTGHSFFQKASRYATNVHFFSSKNKTLFQCVVIKCKKTASRRISSVCLLRYKNNRNKRTYV